MNPKTERGSSEVEKIDEQSLKLKLSLFDICYGMTSFINALFFSLNKTDIHMWVQTYHMS